MSEWRALPRRVRREVIRLAVDGRPHPDPAVARAAVAWARPRRRLIPFLSLPILLAVLLSALPRVFLLVAMLLSLVNLVVMIVWMVLFIRAPKVEIANLRALLPVDRVEPVTVHGRGRFGIADLVGAAGLLAFAAVTVGYRRASDEPQPDLPPPPGAVSLDLAFGVCVVVTVVLPLVVLTGLLLTMILVRPRSTGPLVIVDRTGVTVPHLRLALPWDEIEWVDLAYPRPRGRLSAAIGLWVVPRGRREIIANARPVWWRRVPLAIWLMLCRRALFVPANWMREPPEVVVGAAVGLLRDHRERAVTQPA